MRPRLVILGLAAGVAAALLASRRRLFTGDPGTNGGASARTERLRREIEQARERLREQLARMREE